MRSLIFTCCIMLLFPAMLMAQHGRGRTQYEVGIKFGANIAKLNGDTWEGGFKTNLVGGLNGGIRGGRVGVALEALYSQSTYETGKSFYDFYSAYYNNAADSLKKGSFSVNHINVPLLLQIKVMPVLWIQVGPQYSAVLSKEDKDNLLKGNDFKKIFDKSELSGVAGVHIRLPAHFNITGRYIFGLTDVKGDNFNAAASKGSDVWKQRQIQVCLGYNFL